MSKREDIRPTLESAHVPSRPERIPLHKQTAQLRIKTRPGMHGCLVSDILERDGTSRIENYLKAGYTFMKEVPGLAVADTVKFSGQEYYKGDGDYIRVRTSSKGETGIYMEIPTEIWEADQREMEYALQSPEGSHELVGRTYGHQLDITRK